MLTDATSSSRSWAVKVGCLWSTSFPWGQRMVEWERTGPSVCGGRTQAVHMEKPGAAVSPAVVSEHRYVGVFPAVTSIVCSCYGSTGSGTCDNSSLSPLVHFSLWVTLELLLTACHCVFSHRVIWLSDAHFPVGCWERTQPSKPREPISYN